MDNTLESIRPSENLQVKEELSYLFGRDPSILAYGQRPCPSKDTQKNLYSLYYVDEENSNDNGGSLNSDSQSTQTVKVYLRLKPFPKKIKLSQDEQEAYQIINSTTLYTKLPTLDNNTSHVKRPNLSDIVCRKYTFTKTFGPETTQLDLFDQAVKQQMIDFLAGQNSTIMTYGTTNAGKSYTLQGTTTSPGIIPRGLEFVFSNITPKALPCYKPVNHCDVVVLDPLERAQELEVKTKLLTFTSVDKYQYTNAYKEMQKLLQEESPMRPSQCNDAHYSVWVSFAEIYNETIYDLLSNECQKKKTPLKLATDSQGRAFIKGLKTVCVNSGSEAYQVLMAGQYNLKVAATALNARSSRSHCIFTIKLLKYYSENMPNDVDVSTFAFCDLAGSERLKKTLNIGDRLKEAQNINTSLLVLGRCLKTIHEGQLAKQKSEHIGPFRESKLTRLFQKALSGKENIALIVNINPLPNLYVETQNVLSFSAIAKKIVIEKDKPKKKMKSRFSQLVTQSIKSVTDWDATELESEEWPHTTEDATSASMQQDDYEILLSENEALKKEIAMLKSNALTRDLEIRQEMADTYTAMMKELEADWKNRIKDVEEQQQDVLEWSVKQVEDFYKQKLDQLNSRKRRRSCLSDNENENDDESINLQELEIQNSRLTSKVVSLKHALKQVKEANEELTAEKSRISFELGLTKEELKTIKDLLNVAQQDVCSDDETRQYTKALEEQLYAKQEQVKKLKVFLNEAKEEYIAITGEAREKEYQLKEQEELIVENEEKIEELESHLEHINICLTEKTKTVETLEEKVEAQTQKLQGNENEIKDLKNQLNKLEHEKTMLVDEIELLKKERDTKKSVAMVDSSNQTDECKDSPKDNKSEQVTVEKVICVLDDTVESLSKEVQTEETEVKLTSDMEEKVIKVQTENTALKERLTENLSVIEILKEELDSAKLKVKNIAEQITQLQLSHISSKVNDEVNDKSEDIGTKKTVTFSEIGCQADDLQIEPNRVSSTENTEEKYSQTNEVVTAEVINQTSFIEDSNETDVVDEWAKLVVKYHDLKDEYKTKCLKNSELEELLCNLETTLKDVKQENISNGVIVEEYKQSINLLQNELTDLRNEKKQTEDTLKHSSSTAEQKILDYDVQLKEVQSKLRTAENDYARSKEELESVIEKLNNYIVQCKTQHEQISALQVELSEAKERVDIKSQCLDVHAAKITELEYNLENVTELQNKISELNKMLQDCQDEKDRIQELLNENNEKILELEDRLENADYKEREKEMELCEMQKEMKRMIQKMENSDKCDKMEIAMKDTLRDLTETRQQLSQREDEINNLKSQAKSYEQNQKFLELLQQTAQERQAENERLRSTNEDLKRNLLEKEHEMETFLKNRDQMVSKYEALVKSQQDELERQKKALPKQDSNRREINENTSEDEVSIKEPRTKKNTRKAFSPAKTNEISVIDISSSDSKRNVRHMTLAAPTNEFASERKRTTRRKKLYVQEDESFQDIEPHESTVTVTPMSQTRSLRSRRK